MLCFVCTLVEIVRLHYLIVRATPALRYGPADVLLGHLDAACFAVQAVLCIDDQVLLPLCIRFSIFIHLCRTKSLLWPCILLDRDLRRDTGKLLLDAKVGRLVVIMIRTRSL